MKKLKRYVFIIIIDILFIILSVYIFIKGIEILNMPHEHSYINPHPVESFNNQFLYYGEKHQSYGQISSLLKRLMSNCKLYADEPNRVPSILFLDNPIVEYNIADGNQLLNYYYSLDSFNDAILETEDRSKKYAVSFSYDEEGYISSITISNEDTPINAVSGGETNE